LGWFCSYFDKPKAATVNRLDKFRLAGIIAKGFT